MMHYEENRQYIPLKRAEMMRQAEHRVLVQAARAGQRRMIYRFYHAALAQFGHWLVVSGNHLQRRYGEISELSQAPRKPIRAIKAK